MIKTLLYHYHDGMQIDWPECINEHCPAKELYHYYDAQRVLHVFLQPATVCYLERLVEDLNAWHEADCIVIESDYPADRLITRMNGEIKAMFERGIA